MVLYAYNYSILLHDMVHGCIVFYSIIMHLWHRITYIGMAQYMMVYDGKLRFGMVLYGM